MSTCYSDDFWELSASEISGGKRSGQFLSGGVARGTEQVTGTIAASSENMDTKMISDTKQSPRRTSLTMLLGRYRSSSNPWYVKITGQSSFKSTSSGAIRRSLSMELTVAKNQEGLRHTFTDCSPENVPISGKVAFPTPGKSSASQNPRQHPSREQVYVHLILGFCVVINCL